MLNYSEALQLLLSELKRRPEVELTLERLNGHVLSRPLVAKMPQPAFDNSRMDGFGVRLADVAGAAQANPVALRIQSTVQAGDNRTVSLQPGSAVRIMTGAPIPVGVEAVLKQEDCWEENVKVLISRSPAKGENIRWAGEEFAAGQTIIPAGARATPPVLGLLAAQGYSSFFAFAKPAIALTVTGSEIVMPGNDLKSGCIYDANTSTVAAALTASGFSVSSTFAVKDERDQIVDQLAKAFGTSDVVVTVGGVSVGRFDLVASASEQLGFAQKIWRVKIKPGKPFYFAMRNVAGRKQYLFGLPGNPVSALVVLHQLVLPALRRLSGAAAVLPEQVEAILSRPLRKDDPRLEFVRARLTKDEEGAYVVTPVEKQESHMLTGLAKSNCLVHFPAEAELLEKGARVTADLIDWVFLGRQEGAECHI